MSRKSTAAQTQKAMNFREHPAYKRLVRAFARMLTKYRESKGLSIEELAGKSGVSISRLKNFETGKAAPDIDELFRLAPVYGIPASKIADELAKLHEVFIREEERVRQARAAP